MNFSELEYEVCRICLEHNASFNWNDEIFEFPGVSYKDCYYKYTQMEESDADFYPTSLCSKCANEVKNAHTLFEKALKSFIILQNMVPAERYESFSDSCNGLQEFVDESCTLDENNLIGSNKNEAIDIDEVICYSPVNDDHIVETDNDFKETSKSHDKSTQHFERPYRIQSEKQSMDTFDIKLLNSVDKANKNKRNTRASLNTEVKLKLQLEIHGSKLLKSTNRTFATKTCKSWLKESLKNTQNVFKDKRIRRTQYSGQNSSLKISLENTESQQSSSKICFDNNVEPNKPLNYPLKNPNVAKSDINSFETFCPKRLKHKELQKPFVSKDSEKEEKVNKLSDNYLLEDDDAENYMSSSGSSNANSSLSKEPETYSLTDKSIETKEKTLKSSEMNDIPEDPRVKLCQYCSVKILGTKSLLLHEATHLEHRERNIICPKCGLRLYTKTSLSEHIKTHDKNRERKHKCEFCEKAFFHRGALNVHRRIHLGLVVKCQMCPKEYYRQVDLDRHLVRTHSVSPLQNSGAVKKYVIQCQYCNKSVRTSNWRSHKAAHLKQPQMKCKICNREFYARKSCSNHLKRRHRKAGSEIEENIHFYVVPSFRTSNLMYAQLESAKPLNALVDVESSKND